MTQERISAAAYRQRQGLTPPGQGGIAPATSKAKPQIRIPKPRKMTKCEEECERLLQIIYPAAMGFVVFYEPWTFKLPSGTRYTPDFVVMDGNRIYEVTESKGPKILNGHTIRAFKEAKAAFPALNFVFRQKMEDGWATT